MSHAETVGRRRQFSRTLALLMATALVLLFSVATANAAPPEVTIGTPAAVSYASAEITGEIEPADDDQVIWEFEVSTNGVDWQSTNLQGLILPGERGVTVPDSGKIEGLRGGTTYQVRLKAFDQSNFSEAYSPAPNPEFTTLPVDPPSFASANDASKVGYTTAEASGEVERPAGNADPAFDVNCRFEYVTDQQFNENVSNSLPGFQNAGSAPCSQNPIKVGGVKTQVTAQLQGLQVDSTYHLRLHAETAGGVLNDDAPDTFTTLDPSSPVVTIDPVTAIGATTAHFSGQITPGGTDPVFDTNWEFRCNPACPNLSGQVKAGLSPVDVDVDATGLEPNIAYQVELVATNSAGRQGSDGPVNFMTHESAPGVQTIPAFVLEGGASALLGARVNPHNSATKYWFELEGPGGEVVIPSTKDAPAGNGPAAQFVTQKALNLSPGTTYHFNVVATSTGGNSEGESVPFTTPTPAPAEGECSNKQFRIGPSVSLPDCRAFELASAPDLHGYSIKKAETRNGETLTPFSDVAEDGNATLWATDGLLPENDSDGLYDNYISRRTPEGWRSEFVSPPGQKITQTPLLQYADPNLDRLVYEAGDQTIDPTDPDAGLNSHACSSGGTYCSNLVDLMRREPDGQFVRISKGPAETPVASEPGTGSEAGKPYVTETATVVRPRWVSRDAMHMAFSWVGPKLTSDGLSGAYVGDGQTTTAIVDPTGGGVEIDGISDDGGTIAYQAGNGSENFLKVRTDGLTRTITVGSSGGGFRVWHLSGDGQSLLYSSSAQETGDDTDASSDLYEYDLATETSHRLSAPTGAPTGADSGNSNSCPSSWRGDCAPDVVTVSNDGSRVYFVSPERLDGGRGVEGEPNLYYRAGGVTTYVASLVPADQTGQGPAGPFGGLYRDGSFIGLAANAAQFTPDQSKLVFQSQARLTAYDNHGFKEIYLYDPAAGEITCSSCRLDGAQPAGNAEMRLEERPYGFKEPDAPVRIVASDDSGDHIFFATYDSLRPGDTDQRSDVYSADLRHGTIAALGNITDDQDNFFWGSAAGGRDVFIASTSRLTDEERSVGAYKLWDARIGGGFAPPIPPPGETCEGDPCHGAGSEAPASAGSGTSRFEGPGNPPVKHKKHKKHGTHHKHRKHGKGKKHAAKHRADDKRRNH